MKTKAVKKLSFEPLYHRRVSQGKYSTISSKAIKADSANLSSAVLAERDGILAQGFSILEIEPKKTFVGFEDPDKGDVAAVLANTNPLYKLSVDTENE